MASKPATVGHPAFRAFCHARAHANKGLLALLISLRLARYELDRLPKSQADALLGTYFEHEIPDIRDFNYRASAALGLMSEAEVDLAYMAVPFATSFYETYLGDLARLLARDGHGRVPARAGAVKLHSYLATAGLALPTKEALLFEAIRTIRNCLAHAAGIADAEAEAALAAVAADGSASAGWIRIAKAPVPAVVDGDPIPMSGREALVALYAVAHCAYALNNAASSSITAETWADVVVLDFRMSGTRRWAHRLTDLAPVRRLADRSYSLVGLSDSDLRAAIGRAPHTRTMP